MTAISEDVSEDDECYPDEAMEVESGESGSQLDLRGCESPFPSQLLACAERQAAGIDGCALPCVCEPAWVWLPTPGQPMQAVHQGIAHTNCVENCCVMLGGEPLQQECHAFPPPVLCLSEALQAALEADLPSSGSASHHLGQCQPCAFTAKGCVAGKSCAFCHLCDPSEHKRKKKEKRVLRRAAEWAEKAVRAVGREQERRKQR